MSTTTQTTATAATLWGRKPAGYGHYDITIRINTNLYEMVEHTYTTTMVWLIDDLRDDDDDIRIGATMKLIEMGLRSYGVEKNPDWFRFII